MAIQMLYGTTGHRITVPASRATVVRPRHREAAPDQLAAVVQAVRHPVAGQPLRSLAIGARRAVISVCDITRPQPRPVMLRAVLDEIADSVRPEDVTILIATGTHRPNTDAELRSMLGSDVVDTCRVINHDARDAESVAWVGNVDDVPVYLSREWLAADLRITTGFVEPHFFAGFSGGPKMIAPGLAGLETVLRLHDASRVGHPDATWGRCVGNPVHDAIRAAAALAPATMSIDVLLDGRQRITRAFAGPTQKMHEAARDAVRAEAMCPVDGRFDVVVTSNAGFPLDQNLYQSVKGMSAAAEIVRDGGTIICVTECREGVPDHGSYGALLRRADTPAGLLALIGSLPAPVPDQWQVQIQARIQQRARVLVHSDGLSDTQLREAHLEPVRDVSEAVDEVLRSDPAARVCVLPEGPQTIAYPQ